MSTNDPQDASPPLAVPPAVPPPVPVPPVQYATPGATAPPRSGREQYNVIADTVIGPNLRVKDNVIQAVAIGVCLILGIVVGAMIVRPNDRSMGIVFGALAGLLVGLFGSGIFLMIYRGVRHMRGKHD